MRLLVADTRSYKETTFAERELKSGQLLTFEYPNILFVVLQSNPKNKDPSDFQLTYTYVDRVPADVEAGTAEHASAVIGLTQSASSRQAVSDNLFWVAGGVGLALIAVVVMSLVYCMLTKRNMKLKEKVIMMKKLNEEECDVSLGGKNGPQATPFMDNSKDGDETAGGKSMEGKSEIKFVKANVGKIMNDKKTSAQFAKFIETFNAQ